MSANKFNQSAIAPDDSELAFRAARHRWFNQAMDGNSTLREQAEARRKLAVLEDVEHDLSFMTRKPHSKKKS